jgi:putative membrane protein
MKRRNQWWLAGLAAVALGVSAPSAPRAADGTGKMSDTGKRTSADRLTPSRAEQQSQEGTGSSAANGEAVKAPGKKLIKGLEKLHSDNQAEIEAGRMAAQSASSPQVKEFAERMVKDHTANDQKLTELAQKQGIPLELKHRMSGMAKGEESMGDLHGKSGADFDKAYISDMVKDHEKDEKAVRKLSEDAQKDNQAELASFLTETHQAIGDHLSMARQLRDTTKNEKKEARNSSASTGMGATKP